MGRTINIVERADTVETGACPLSGNYDDRCWVIMANVKKPTNDG